MATYFQLGRTDDLALLELQALLGNSVQRLPLATAAVAVYPETLDAEAARNLQNQLGGTIRILQASDLKIDAIVEFLARAEGEPIVRDIGISTLGLAASEHAQVVSKLSSLLKARGGARLILPKQKQDHELRAAQVLGNRLTSHPRAAEVVVVNGMLTRTLAVSNPDAFAQRDRGIPRPDAKNGMLPPKLALMMVNCATKGVNMAVYDPFCGSGRILLEAAAQGHAVLGSDLAPLQVSNARANLAWIEPYAPFAVWEADATRPLATKLPEAFCIATEPYLGEPRRHSLPEAELQSWTNSVYPRIVDALVAWRALPQPPQRICMVLPAPVLHSGKVSEVPVRTLVDRLPELGYALRARAWYARPDALVHRCIVCLEPVTP